MHLAFISVHIEHSARAVPLGPAMLSSALRQRFSNTVKTDVLNFYLDQSADECLEQILDSRAEYLGFSMFIWNRDRILEIANELKEAKPGIVIFLGGPEASADFDELNKNECIDFILKGEGEAAIVQAVDGLLREKSVREISENSKSPSTPKLEDLPSPYLDGTLNPDDYSGLLWELSRGCPFKCDFCFESRGSASIRRFSKDRITAELELFKQHNVRQIFVLDPTFNYRVKTAKEILHLIIESETDIHFSLEIRSEFLDEEMAGLFSYINCSLQIGMQSADPDVLKNINRKIDQELFEEKVLLLHEAGVVYGFDLIYGLPGDTLEGFYRSLDFAMAMVPNHVDIFPLSVLPGTRLKETASSFDITYMRNNPYTVLSTPQFSESDMEAASNLADACDLFYNQGKAVPWFFIVVEALGISPSEFFMEFYRWQVENRVNVGDVIKLQREFLTEIFNSRAGDSKACLVASDIAAYFGYTAILLESEHPLPACLPEGCRYFLNPESRFVPFSHDPLELEEHIFSGITTIEELSLVLHEETQEVFIFLNEGAIDIRFFSSDEIDLLKSAETGMADLPDDEELNIFFKSCISENIILLI